MSSRIGDRMSATRRQRFVGREDEARGFETRSARRLCLFKSCTFRTGRNRQNDSAERVRRARRAKKSPRVLFDARNVEPSPQSLLDTLRVAMGLAASVSPMKVSRRNPLRHILLIDTLEFSRRLTTGCAKLFCPSCRRIRF